MSFPHKMLWTFLPPSHLVTALISRLNFCKFQRQKKNAQTFRGDQLNFNQYLNFWRSQIPDFFIDL